MSARHSDTRVLRLSGVGVGTITTGETFGWGLPHFSLDIFLACSELMVGCSELMRWFAFDRSRFMVAPREPWIDTVDPSI